MMNFRTFKNVQVVALGTRVAPCVHTTRAAPRTPGSPHTIFPLRLAHVSTRSRARSIARSLVRARKRAGGWPVRVPCTARSADTKFKSYVALLSQDDYFQYHRNVRDI